MFRSSSFKVTGGRNHNKPATFNRQAMHKCLACQIYWNPKRQLNVFQICWHCIDPASALCWPCFDIALASLAALSPVALLRFGNLHQLAWIRVSSTCLDQAPHIWIAGRSWRNIQETVRYHFRRTTFQLSWLICYREICITRKTNRLGRKTLEATPKITRMA